MKIKITRGRSCCFAIGVERSDDVIVVVVVAAVTVVAVVGVVGVVAVVAVVAVVCHHGNQTIVLIGWTFSPKLVNAECQLWEPNA